MEMVVITYQSTNMSLAGLMGCVLILKMTDYIGWMHILIGWSPYFDRLVTIVTLNVEML